MAISLDELLKARESGPWGYDLSPDGNDVIYSADAGDSIQVFHVSLYGGEPRPLTAGGPDRLQPRWSPSAGLLACTEEHADGSSGVAVFSLKGGEAAWRSAGGHEAQPEWSPDGLRLCYVSRQGETWRVMVWDSQSRAEICVAEHGEPVYGPTWSPDGSWLPYLVGADPEQQALHTVSSYGQSPPRRLNTPHLVRAGKARWSPAGRVIAAVSQERGFHDIVLVNSTTGRPTFLCPEPAERINPVFSANGSLVAYEVLRQGNRLLELFPVPATAPVAGGWTPTPRAQAIGRPEGTMTAPRFTPGKMRVVYAHTGHRDPWELYVQIVDGGHPQRLTFGSGGLFDAGALVAPVAATYPGPAGPVAALLYRSAGDSTAAVVIAHDGPGGSALNRYDPLVQHLVSRGVSVLVPDYRGSRGHGAAAADRDGAAADLAAAAAWLQGQGLAPLGAGLFGEGYGGAVALQAAGAFAATVAATGLGEGAGAVTGLGEGAGAAGAAGESVLIIAAAGAPAPQAAHRLTLPADRGGIARSARPEAVRSAVRWLAERLAVEEG